MSDGRNVGVHHFPDATAQSLTLDPERPTKPPGGIVGFRTVVIQKNRVEAAITKQGASESPDGRRRLHPARRFRIESSQFLQLSILFFRQKFNAHGRRHANSAVFWLVFFSGIEGLTVVANTSAAFRTFRRTIIKNVFARLLVVANNVGFTTGSFHFVQRPQFVSVPLKLGVYFRPLKTWMAVHVFLKAGFQNPEQFFTPFVWKSSSWHDFYAADLFEISRRTQWPFHIQSPERIRRGRNRYLILKA